jgi:hypothetical protein
MNAGVRVRLVKVRIDAEFVLDDGGVKPAFLEPGVFGPLTLTAREWASFDLQTRIEQEIHVERGSAD